MKKTREQKGITLIALIITIVVLLILAVVAINAIKGDGIIQYVQNAASDYEKVQTEEEALLKNYLNIINENNPNGVKEYKEYVIGEEVTINGETFYVIEDSDKTDSIVKLLAKDCIVVDETSDDYLKQSVSARTVAFSKTNYWSSEFTLSPYDIKELNEADIAAKYASEYGTAVGGTGRLMRKSEADALESENSDILYGKNGKSSSTQLVYWLGSAYSALDAVWCVEGYYEFIDYYSYNNDSECMVRPVVEILKSKIS